MGQTGLCPESRHENTKIQITCINRFPIIANSCKLDKIAALKPLLSQQGWVTLPPIVITA